MTSFLIRTSVIITFIFLAFEPASLNAQTYKAWVNAGDQAMDSYSYAEAIEYYSKATEFETGDLQLYIRLGKAFRLYNDYERALSWYMKAFSEDKDGLFPEAVFYIGEMNKYMGRYTECVKYYNLYLSKATPDSSYMGIKARSEISLMESVKTIAGDSVENVLVENAGSSVNTTYSDFGATVSGDSVLYYASLRFKYTDRSEKKGTERYVSRILKSEVRSGEFSKGSPLFMTINEPSLHNCNVSLSPDHKLMVFTRCELTKGQGLRCDLFYSTLVDGSWSAPLPFPDSVNDDRYTNTQPAVEAIGAEGYRIYFASDRPGGFGKLDLYRVKMDANFRFSVVENLGDDINTFDDELSPFFDSARDVLYFSSYGHAGIGGYDIFKSRLVNGEFTTPENLGPPYNSTVNDLYYSYDRDTTGGTLTSNRVGSYYIRSKTCCYDIYRFSTVEEQPLAQNEEDTMSTDTKLVSTDPMAKVSYQEWLPLILYFENDMPGRRSMSTTTDRSYDDLYNEYLSKYDEYVEGHTGGLSGEEGKIAEQAISTFFNDFVTASFNELSLFTARISEALTKGASIRITVRGQASPLADSRYNENLSKRRVASLVNYFRRYKDGMLLSYINDGTFTIEEVAAGESLSAKDVSDKLEDTRNSVYSPKASKERLIEVIDIFIEQP